MAPWAAGLFCWPCCSKYADAVTKTDDAHPEGENLDLPHPSEFPRVTVNRGLLGIPEALAFWRRKKPASS